MLHIEAHARKVMFQPVEVVQHGARISPQVGAPRGIGSEVEYGDGDGAVGGHVLISTRVRPFDRQRTTGEPMAVGG